MPPIMQNEEISRGKRVMRYSLHLLHLILGTFLFASLVLDLYIRLPITPKTGPGPLYILYLFPTTILILFSESCYLLRRRPPFLSKLEESRLAPRDLRRRSFLYQLSGVFIVGWSSSEILERDHARAIGWIKDLGFGTWFIGVLLFCLAVSSRGYRFRSWVEEPVWESTGPSRNVDQPDQDLLVVEDTRGKRFTRYTIHIIHLFLIFILMGSIIVNFFSIARQELILYLLPFIVTTLLVEIPYLFLYRPRKSVLDSFLATPTLKSRSFTYQLCGAFVMGWSSNTSLYWYDPFIQAAWQFGFLVWICGLALFAVAIAGEAYGFRDWLDEMPRDSELTGTIRLPEDSTEDVVGQPSAPDTLV